MSLLTKEIIHKLIRDLHFPINLTVGEIEKIANSIEYKKIEEEFSQRVLESKYRIPKNSIENAKNDIENLKQKYFFNSSQIGFYDFTIMPNLRALEVFLLHKILSQSINATPFFTYKLLNFPSNPLSNVEHASILFPTIILESENKIKIYGEVPIVTNKAEIPKIVGNTAVGYVKSITGQPFVEIFEKIIENVFNIKPLDFSQFVNEVAKTIEKYSNKEEVLQPHVIYVINPNDGKVSKTQITSFREADKIYTLWRPSANFYYAFYIVMSPTRFIYDTLDVENTDKGLEEKLDFLKYCNNVVPKLIPIPTVNSNRISTSEITKKFAKLVGIDINNTTQLSLIDYKIIFSTSLLSKIKDEVEEMSKNMDIKNMKIEEVPEIIINAVVKVLGNGKIERISKIKNTNRKEIERIIEELFNI